MINHYLLERIEAIQNNIMTVYQGGKGMPSANKGNERETFVREYLQRVFPAGYRFGTGAITDSEGNRSGQLDVVIEYPLFPSFPMSGGSDRLYLAESVAAVISVKSDLSRQWNEVTEEANKLIPLRRRWLGGMMSREGVVTIAGPLESPIPFVAVGYTGYKTIKGLHRRLESTNLDERPLAALSIESGVFVTSEIQMEGPLGFYALAVWLAAKTLELIRADADGFVYVQD